MAMFNSYVKLPEGIYSNPPKEKREVENLEMMWQKL